MSKLLGRCCIQLVIKLNAAPQDVEPGQVDLDKLSEDLRGKIAFKIAGLLIEPYRVEGIEGHCVLEIAYDLYDGSVPGHAENYLIVEEDGGED